MHFSLFQDQSWTSLNTGIRRAAEEMTVLVKSLLQQHEDLSSDLQQACAKQGVVVWTRGRGAGRVETGGLPGQCLAQCTLGSLKDLVSTQKREPSKKAPTLHTPMPICTLTCTQACLTHRHICTCIQSKLEHFPIFQVSKWCTCGCNDWKITEFVKSSFCSTLYSSMNSFDL